LAEQFKNEDYIVNVTKDSGCRVELSVEMSPKASLSQWKKALKTISKQISLPGFRKGKAPESLLIDQYKGHIESEWKKELLQEAFTQSTKLTNLYPFRQETIRKAQVDKASKEEMTQVSFAFETFPDVPKVDINSISYTAQEAKEVKDADVEAVIEDIRYQSADWTQVEGRSVEEGDFVNLDIENLDNPGQMLIEDTRLEAKEKKMGSWLLNTVIGMKVGEFREETSQKHEDEVAETFIPTRCKITLKSIHQATLPPVDDELAKNAKADSLEDLKGKIRKDLESQAKKTAESKNRTTLVEAIVEAHPFELPNSITVQEQQALLSDKAAMIGASALSAEEKQSALKNAEVEAKKQAESNLRWQLIVDKIAQEKNMEADRSEIYLELLKERMANPGEHPDSLSEEEQRRNVMRAYRRVISQKVADLLLDELSFKESKK